MRTLHTAHDRLPTELLARALGAVGLAAMAVIHVVDLPDTWDETPLIGVGYLLLIAAALTSATLLITIAQPRVWALADLTALSAIVGYVLSRTSGLPTDTEDVGNWGCLLGIAALSTEAIIVLLAAWRMRPQRPAPIGDDDRADTTPSDTRIHSAA